MQLSQASRSCSTRRFVAASAPSNLQPCQTRWRTAALSKSVPDTTNDRSIIASRRSILELMAAPVVLSSLQQLAYPLAAPAAAAGLALPDDATYQAVRKAFQRNATKGKAPVLLRLVFHDAGTFSAAAGDGGINASIRFELDRPENFGLKRGWRVIEQVKSSLKGTPAEAISFADLIALAGAYAVEVTGGPKIPVPIGRKDATSADPEDRLPAETLSSAELKACFAAKGLSAQQLVALSGAHTIGGKGFGDAETFDNAYYSSLLAKPWLDPKQEMASMIGLPSDHVLPEDPELLPIIQHYAGDQQAFFSDFSQAYLALASLGV